ncbi:MAG: type II secretion system protein [bacterium]
MDLRILLFCLFLKKDVQTRFSKKTNIVKKCFTLAEVLMTLTILGVVAAITMVILLPNIQNAQNITKWIVAFSDLAQVTEMIKMNNCGTMKGICSDGDNNCMRDKYTQYMNVIKSCNTGAAAGNCWHSIVKREDGSVHNGSVNIAAIILNNGNLIQFWHASKNCTSGGYNKKCTYILVDINGWKGPNTLGKDIFGLYATENSTKPMGFQGDAAYYSDLSIGLGYSAKYLKEK